MGALSQTVQADEVPVVDVNRPFAFACGAALSLNTSADDLALPSDPIRKAGPLYGLFSRHIIDVTQNADLLSGSPAAGMLGAASIELSSPRPRRRGQQP